MVTPSETITSIRDGEKEEGVWEWREREVIYISHIGQFDSFEKSSHPQSDVTRRQRENSELELENFISQGVLFGFIQKAV